MLLDSASSRQPQGRRDAGGMWVRPGVHGISANPAKKFVATGPSVLTQFLVNLQSHSLKYPGSHFHHIE